MTDLTVEPGVRAPDSDRASVVVADEDPGVLRSVREIEERGLNAWPALSRIFLDGWILGLSEGYTRRANSVNPIYPGLLDGVEKVPVCEATYARRGLPIVFKLTPLSAAEDLDGFLARRAYEKVATTRVQTLNLSGVLDVRGGTEVIGVADDAWMADYGRIKRLGPGELKMTRSVLERIGIATRFVSVRQAGRRVAAGIGAIEGSYVGLFGIATDPDFRGLGLGRRVTNALLDAGSGCGAKIAYLQVEEENSIAHHLYESIGFREVYQYWYRVKKL